MAQETKLSQISQTGSLSDGDLLLISKDMGGGSYQSRALPGSAVATPSDLTFEQAFTSLSVVTVNHNLGRRPSVTVIDSAGDECIGDVDHLSNNSLTVTFSAPFSGTVLCN